jgi:phosphoribosylamine-glycine ligase
MEASSGGEIARAGNEVVIEELLLGPELSVLAFSDGYSIIPLPAAQDHKRIGEGDVGPNTGGMGAYAPAPVATPAVMERIMNETLRPTIDNMRKEGALEHLLRILQFLELFDRLSVRRPALHRVHPNRNWP